MLQMTQLGRINADKLEATFNHNDLKESYTERDLCKNLLFPDFDTFICDIYLQSCFEEDKIDEHCEKGFFKDARHSQPQIVLGLLVSTQVYPLLYSISNGSQYEGRTILPIVEDFINRFGLADFVIVADTG